MTEGARAQTEPERISIGDNRFYYRAGDRDAVFLWANPGNYGEPFLATEMIAEAAAEIREITGREHAFFSAAPAPEHFDQTPDSDRVMSFNQRVIDALLALGVPRDEAQSVFRDVGMPSEWRGAMWQAATMAEGQAIRTDLERDYMQRITTLFRFMAISMTVDGSFRWSLAVANRVLGDAIRRFQNAEDAP